MALTLTLVLVTGVGELAAATFQAKVVQSRGDERQVSALYVDGDKVREEFTRADRRFIRIRNPERGAMWLVVPERQQYGTRPLPQGGSPDSPEEALRGMCTAQDAVRCEAQGTETVAGRPARKWRIVSHLRGRPQVSYQWFDQETELPVRQVRPNGSMVELVFQETTEYNGRPVQIWDSVMQRPNGEQQRGRKWYDPALETMIRETYPGGGYRELTDIRVGDLDDALFQPPADYREIEARQPNRNPPEPR